jgi:hypothetical protein
MLALKTAGNAGMSGLNISLDKAIPAFLRLLFGVLQEINWAIALLY